MLGFSLIHAGFLAAGLAVVVPIVIHLLFRQRTRNVVIGSVRFLHQVVKEHRRRRRVRQWILLALRMLALLLLAMLFCRPYWDQSVRRGLEQEIVLLIDRSASMQAKSSQQETSFDRAVARAKDEIAHLDDNVIVHVALCDAAGVQEVAVDELPTAVASEAATDYGLSLTWARDILAASNRATRRIIVLTDLQRTGLPRVRMDALPSGMELVVEDVGDALPRNVSVESAEAVRTEIRPDSHVTVRTVLRNHGPLAVRKLQVRCDVEGSDGEKLNATQETDLNGRGSVVLEFLLQIQHDGLYRGQIAIEINDALILDNRRWIGFEARHPDRVLLVDGQEGRSNFGNETYFLETALRLQTEDTSGVLRSFEPDKMVWESGEGFPKLDGYRAVVLANLRRLSKSDGERLDAYVRGGGNLLLFAGDQVTPESLSPLAEHGLLPGKVASTPVEGRLRIDQWDAKHPALACFSDPQQGDLRRVELRKILPLSGLGSAGRMLLQSGGHLVAGELPVDKGRVIYFASTANREWTDLPRTPMYVPLMRQLLAHLTDQLEARSAVTRKFVTKAGEKTGIAPTGDVAGHWTVTNLDPRESALERVGPEVLQKLAGVPELNAEEEAQQAALKIQLPADSLRPDEIWPAVTWILLAVLVAEMLLAGKVHA
jgi:hypothetical protein